MTTPSGTTRYTCPLPGCGWSQDIHTSDQATALMDLELAMRIHVDDHSPLEYLRALTTAQDTWKASAGILEAEGRLRAELGTATRHAHTVDAERAETEAALLVARAEVQRARAREARARAEAVTAQAALDAVRRLCNVTIDASVRVQAVDQARDTLTVIDRATAGQTTPGDDAWGTVWLEGNWRYLTTKMTTPEREHAADAVARWSATLDKADGEDRGEPDGLRWWRES